MKLGIIVTNVHNITERMINQSCVQFILDAEDERALYQWKGLHFEKLKGKRKYQRSIRLDRQFRLIIEIERSAAGTVVALKGIEDYQD